MPDPPLESFDRALLLALVVSALSLSLPTLWPQPLVLDEHASYWLCEPDVPLSILERNIAYSATPPLSSWFERAALELFGRREWCLRLPSVLGYVVAVVGMFFGCRPLLSARGAALSALALAWHPDVVDEIRIARPYGLALAAMVALTVLSLRIVLHLTRTREETPATVGILWGAAAGAAIWTHVLCIPPIALTALSLCGIDFSISRRLRRVTIAALLVALVFGLLLTPMLLRMWYWRHSLNFETGVPSLLESLGAFVWLALPVAGALAVGTRRRSTPDPTAAKTHRQLLILLLLSGVVPAVGMAIGAQAMPSLNSPRYRLPLATAQACLFGLLLGRQRRFVGIAALVLAVSASWLVLGRSPTTLARLSQPQAPVWEDLGRVLTTTAIDDSLQSADVFVQSGLIEGLLIPALYDDLRFQGYVSSRLGRFYAPTPNPRLALPLFWEQGDEGMLQFYRRRLEAVPAGGSLFVAVATDTDVNRASFAVFAEMLQQAGYEITPIADHQPWAVLYHCRRTLN